MITSAEKNIQQSISRKKNRSTMCKWRVVFQIKIFADSQQMYKKKGKHA